MEIKRWIDGRCVEMKWWIDGRYADIERGLMEGVQRVNVD